MIFSEDAHRRIIDTCDCPREQSLQSLTTKATMIKLIETTFLEKLWFGLKFSATETK